MSHDIQPPKPGRAEEDIARNLSRSRRRWQALAGLLVSLGVIQVAPDVLTTYLPIVKQLLAAFVG